jgi:hypothetical protein
MRSARVAIVLPVLALLSGCDTPVALLGLGLQQAVSQHRWDDVERVLDQSLSADAREALESRIDQYFLRRGEHGCGIGFSPRVVFSVARIHSTERGSMTLTQWMALLTAQEGAPDARVALDARVQCSVTRASGAGCPAGQSPVRYRRAGDGLFNSDAVFAIDGDLLGGMVMSGGGRVPTEAQIREAARRRTVTHEMYPGERLPDRRLVDPRSHRVGVGRGELAERQFDARAAGAAAVPGARADVAMT